MTRRLQVSNFIHRAAAAAEAREERGVTPEPQAPEPPTRPDREPARPRRPEPPVISLCGHCQTYHSDDPCETQRMDMAGSLLYDLRALGATVALLPDGITIRVTGYTPPAEMLERLKESKAALLSILKAEAGQS